VVSEEAAPETGAEAENGEASADAARPRKQLTYEEKVAIIAAYECGKTYSEIAQAFGRYVSTISRFIQHYKVTRSFECKSGRGSKRKTSEKDDKALVRIVMHDRFLTSRKVMEALPTLTVSQRTVRRRIAELSRFKTIPATTTTSVV
jgi:transposase